MKYKLAEILIDEEGKYSLNCVHEVIDQGGPARLGYAGIRIGEGKLRSQLDYLEETLTKHSEEIMNKIKEEE